MRLRPHAQLEPGCLVSPTLEEVLCCITTPSESISPKIAVEPARGMKGPANRGKSKERNRSFSRRSPAS